MAKCIECGADIADGQELCEHCANSQNSTSELEESYLDDLLTGLSDDFSLSEEELNDFDISNIGDIDLGDFGDISIINDNIEETPIQDNLDNLEMPILNDLEIEMPVLDEVNDSPIEEISTILDETDNNMEDDLLPSQNITDVELTEMPVFDDDDEADDEMEMLLQNFSTQSADTSEADLDDTFGGVLNDLDVVQKEPTLVEMGLPPEDDDDDAEMDDLLSFLSTDMEVGGSDSSKSADNDNSLFSLDNLMEMEEENALISDSMHSKSQEANEMLLNANESDEEAFESDLMDIINKGSEEEKTKKKGLFDKLFGNIHDAKSKREHEKMLSAEEKKELRKKEKAEKKAAEKAKKEDPAYKAEQEAKKREKEEKKAQEKAVKEAKKKEKEEKKKQRKAELEAQLEAEAKEDQGRINPVGAAIVFVCLGAFAAFVILGTNNFSYKQSVAKAKEYFGSRYYTEAYNEVRGVELKDEDIETYDKIVTVMYVNKQWNSYNNYYAMQMYPEALDSLLKGLQKYDEYITDGEQLGVVNDLDYVRGQIKKELKKVFSMSEKKAYSIINSSTQEEYSQKVIEASKVAE